MSRGTPFPFSPRDAWEAEVFSDLYARIPYDTEGRLTALEDRATGTVTRVSTIESATGNQELMAEFLLASLSPTTPNARRLQGTANQVILTDGGIYSDLVLSLPQDIHTAATPQFAELGLGDVTAPDTMLHLHTPAGNVAIKIQVDSAKIGAIDFYEGAVLAGNVFWAGASNYLGIMSLDFPVKIATGAGFVSIGDVTAGTKLHVTGDVTFATRLKSYVADGWTGSAFSVWGIDAGAGKKFVLYDYNTATGWMTLSSVGMGIMTNDDVVASMLQVGKTSVTQQWTSNTIPQVMISGVDNEAAALAFKIQDENQNEYLAVRSVAGQTYGRVEAQNLYAAQKLGVGIVDPAYRAVIKFSDAAGADRFSLQDSAGVEQGYINSDAAIWLRSVMRVGAATEEVIIGLSAGNSFTSGLETVFIGLLAGFYSTGNYNTFVGGRAGTGGTGCTGVQNTGIGRRALYSITSGSYNVAVGGNAGYCIRTGSRNFAMGESTIGYTYAGNDNVGIGNQALLGKALDVVMHRNIGLGYEAGFRVAGSDNIFLGYQAGFSEYGSNRLYIEQSASPSPLVYGEFDNKALRFNADVLVHDTRDAGVEVLSETDFTTHANWDITGDFSDTAGYAAYIHSSGAGTLTQTAVHMATPLVGNTWYVFQYTITNSTYLNNQNFLTHEITTGILDTARTIPVHNGTYYIAIKTKAVPGDFVISVTSGVSSGFRMDNVSLKPITGGDLEVLGQSKFCSNVGFFGLTPIGQQAYTAVSNPPTQAEVTAIRDAMVNLGLMATS